MFIIDRGADGLAFSINPPSDDILSGLVDHWGQDVRIVRLTSEQDFQAARQAMEAGATFSLEGTTLTATGPDGSWAGEQIWPTP